MKKLIPYLLNLFLPITTKKKPFFLQKSEPQKKTHFFLPKSKISLQKYQKSVFTHNNKIKNHFIFFQKYEISVQKRTGEDEVEQLPSITGAEEDGRTEGEEKTVGALEQVRLPPLLLLPFLPFVLPLHFFIFCSVAN